MLSFPLLVTLASNFVTLAHFVFVVDFVFFLGTFGEAASFGARGFGQFTQFRFFSFLKSKNLALLPQNDLLSGSDSPPWIVVKSFKNREILIFWRKINLTIIPRKRKRGNDISKIPFLCWRFSSQLGFSFQPLLSLFCQQCTVLRTVSQSSRWCASIEDHDHLLPIVCPEELCNLNCYDWDYINKH